MQPDEEKGPDREDMIKVVDRRGRTEMMPRSEYERKKKGKRKHERHTLISIRSFFSIAIILAIMIVAAYIALKVIG